MATAAERLHESTIGAGQTYWTALIEQLGELSPWLVIAVYTLVHVGALAGAGMATLYLAEVLSGRAGAAVVFIGGVGLIAAAPAVVRALSERVLDAYEGR